MPRPVACPQCREELDIPDEFRGEPVRCSSCGTTFTPPADSPRRRPDYDDSPRRRRDYDEPRRRAPRRSGLGVLLVLAGVFGICALGCVGVLALAFTVENPRLEPWASPDGRFRAAFPKPPTVATRDGLNGGEPTTTLEANREVLGEVTDHYFVHHTDLPNRPGKPAQYLDGAATRFAARVPGTTVVSQSVATVSGMPAVRLELRHPDDTQTFVQLVLADERLYQVGVTGSDLDPSSQRVLQFWSAFQLTGPDERAGPVPPAGKRRGRPAVPAADE